MTLYITASIAILILIWLGISYNNFIRLLNQVDNAWAQIDVQLKRRYDLIPNLIETVKTYMEYESEVLQKITQLRAQAMTAKTIEEKSTYENMLSGALGRFRVAVENYPDLKANSNFLALQEELTSTENKIAFARQNYNDQAMRYNNKVKMFPSNLAANIFGYQVRAFFEIEDSERKAPNVKNNFK